MTKPFAYPALSQNRKKTFLKKLIYIVLVLGSQFGRGQESPPLDPTLQISTIPLYGASTSESSSDSNAKATLTVFRPQPGKGTGSAVVIAPGGGYLLLTSNLEGAQVAEWFTARGFTAFVLNYRLGPKNLFPIPLIDAQRALRLVRSLSVTYGISTKRVGMVGFSSGGHLAALTATVPDTAPADSSDPIDQLSSRPNFLVLGYPWLNAMEPSVNGRITYCGLMHVVSTSECDSFMHPYTPRFHVAKDTAPTFIYATSDDAIVPVQASVQFYESLITAGVSAEMHLFRHGAHGSGLGSGDPALDLWPGVLESWLRDLGLLTVDSAAASPQIANSSKSGGLTLDSTISEIESVSAAVDVVNSVCGPNFLATLPKEAAQTNLRLLSTYFPKQLSDVNLAKIEDRFNRLPNK